MPVLHLCRSLVLALCFRTFFLSPAVTPGHAHAQGLSSPITVTSRTYRVKFPDSIDLSVSATDPVSTIDKATLVIFLSENSPQELHGAPISRVGHTTSASWRENTSGGNFVPPRSQVSYHLQVSDSAGNTLTDTPQPISTTDTRF